MRSKTPYFFDEFFASGMEESISPFLTPSSRKWGKHLSLHSALLSAFLLAGAFVAHFFNPSLSSALLCFIYFFMGIPALLSTFEDFKNFQINIDLLMTAAAFFAALMGNALEGALLLVLFELSGAMEETVTLRAKSAISHLRKLSPSFATLVNEEGLHFERSVKEIDVGAKLWIKAGEIVPLDGIVLEGTSSLNIAHLTGETLPVRASKGESVPAGASNLDAALLVEVVRTSSDSTLERIIRLITEATAAKPKLQRWLDRFGDRYALTIISLTLLFSLGLPFVASMEFFGTEGSIYRALAFMIAASPCALIIGAPTAYLSALSAAARRGIMLKGGVCLDALASCKAIAFDKTGTLTTGELTLQGIEPLTGTMTREQALGIAASLEKQIVHPIAKAVVTYATKEQVTLFPVKDFRALPGIGVEGKVEIEGEFQLARFEQSGKISYDEILSELVVGESRVLFRFSEMLREKAKEMMEEIQRECKLRTVILTGGAESAAKAVAKALAIDEVHHSLKPEDKLKMIGDYATTGGLAMVGDGINDAPSLARASVGISMGKIGSATAVDASDVVLLNDDLHLLGWLFKRAKQTQSVVKQNVILALGVICIAAPLALVGQVPLWLAVLLHEGGTLLVGINSLRLLR